MRKVYLLLLSFVMLFSFVGTAQITVNVTNPTNASPNLSASYSSLQAALVDLNAVTAFSGPVVLTCASGSETTPAGGFVINFTATTTAVNNVVVNGNGHTISAPTPQTAGALNDAIFKIIGSDNITLSGFIMLENAANTVTAAATNTMTEWGVALLYATTTNGAQNITIQNNTITLNRTYANTFGIYSNSNHAATTVTTSASATTSAGGNSGMKVYGNTISNVNNGIAVVGPLGAAADANTGIDIGGSSPATGNTITNYGTTGTFSGYIAVSGTIFGILVRNSTAINVSYNTMTSSGANAAGTLRGIYVPSFNLAPTGTFTNSYNNNTISLTTATAAGAVQGIAVEATTGTATSTTNINNNNFTSIAYNVASPTGAVTIINNGMPNLNTNISGNTFTNLTTTTTGSVTFISNSVSTPASGTKIINGNSIVTAFNKTGAGGTVALYTDGGSSTTGTSVQNNNNNFSNITVSGATTITGWFNNDGTGSTPPKTMTGNTFSNWTGGTSSIIVLQSNWGGNIDLSNNTISNISGQGAITGILQGTSGTIASSTLSNNSVSGLVSSGTGGAVIGISFTHSSTAAVVSQNTIHTLSSTGASSSVTGLNLSGTTTANSVSRNKIYNLLSTGTTSLVSGIAVGTSGADLNIFNNLIGDLRNTAASNGTTDVIRGIGFTGTSTSSNLNVSYNTIYLNASSSGTNFTTSGIYHTTSTTATTASLTLRNNIIANVSTPNGTGLTIAYRRSSGVVNTLNNYNSASNNNLFYAGTPGAATLIYSDGTSSAQTLAAYKTGVFTAGTIAPRDQSSVTEMPPFLSTTGSDATYLHINPAVATQIESGGIPITGITTDFDNNARDASNPDLGADEGTFTLADISGPAISYTSLPSTICLTAPTLSAVITDASDVNVTAGTKPRLYYKRNTDANAFNDNTNATDGWKYVEAANATSPFSFTFNYSLLNGGTGVAAGQTIEYFVVAQDLNGTPNVGITSGTFNANPSSVNLTAAAFPLTGTIRSFNVMAQPSSININITSGASLCFSGTATLAVAAGTEVSGGELQWQSSPAGANTWSDIIGANSSPYTTGTISANTDFRLVVKCGGTPIATSPSGTVSVSVSNPAVTGSTAAARCGEGTVNLSATGSAGTILNWYAGLNTTTILQTGGSFTTPTINNTTTYYVAAELVGTTVTGGARVSTTSTSNTAPSTWGLVFNATSGFILNSVDVYLASATAGNVVMQLQDNTGAVLATKTIAVPAGNATTPVQHTLALGWSIAPGTGYRILAVSGPAMVRESALGGFPYPLGSVGSVTNGYISGTSTTYYFFYNWSFTPVCSSPRTAVIATVTAAPAVTVSATPTTICAGASTNLSVSSGNTGYTYTWTPGGTGSAITQSPSSTTKFYVDALDNSGGANNGCTIRDSVTVTVNAVPNTVILSPTSAAFCIGGSVNLTASSVSSGTGTIGTGSVSNTSTGATSPYKGWYGGHKVQFLYTASELVAAGLSAGSDINSLSMPVTAFTSPYTFNDFTISMKNTVTAALTTTPEAGLTTVLAPSNYVLSGTAPFVISHTLSSSFQWDGTSNLVVEFCFNNNNGGGVSGNIANVTSTTKTGSASYFSADNSATVCATSTGWTTSSTRINLTFGYSTTAAITWSPATGLNVTTGNSVTASPTATTTYTATATNAVNCTTTGNVTVTVDPLSNAGTLNGNQTICTNTAPANIVASGTVGNVVRWESAADAAFTTPTTIANTTSTLSPGTLTATTYYRIVVKSGLCSEAISAPVTITVDPATVGGTVSANQTICSGTAPADLVLSGNVGSVVKWQKIGSGPFSTPVDIASTSTTLTSAMIGALTETSYFRAVVKNGACAETFSSPVTITVSSATVAGTVAGAQTICSGNTPGDLTLTGNTGTVVKWQRSNDAAFASPTDISSTSTTLSGAVIGSLSQNTYFRAVVQNAGCSVANSNAVLITINNTVDNSTPLAGTIGGGPVCANYNVSTTDYALNNCNLIARIQPSGASPVTGTVNACVKIDGSVQIAPTGEPYVQRHYDITPASNATTATSTITLYFLQSEFNAFNTARGFYAALPANGSDATGKANLRITQYNGNGTAPGNYPVGSGSMLDPDDANIVFNAAANRWEITFNATGSGGFYVHTGNFTLPVTLINFRGEQSGSINKLLWSTSTETNNKGFELERSSDGRNYSSINFVASKAENGNSNSTLNYNYNDVRPLAGNNYYRLKQVDKDGKTTFSNVVLLSSKVADITLSSVYPNPTTRELNLVITSPKAEKVTVIVTDLTGKVLMQTATLLVIGDNQQTFNVQQLAAGTYFIKAVCANGCETAVQRFVKQ